MTTLWRAAQPLVLASRSAARQAMLSAALIPFDAVDAAIDERAAEQDAHDLSPSAIAVHLAVAKARAVSARFAGRHVVGADQTLAIGNERLSKPKDLAEAADHLRRMSGRVHELHAGYALVVDGVVKASGVQTARMTMRALSADFIDAYLAAIGGAALSSVGAYQIEGLGLHLFNAIDGDHFTIMGLPLLSLLAALRAEGLVAI